ncbi:hypothetical protein [Halobellus inordinatus]|uniref:hypothetical protein n=1 Tax=Halobellus inordinatus TaxID=1126236 RepID=UPI0021098871|nr:hypothetical protein [Halobellus inordinatus]
MSRRIASAVLAFVLALSLVAPALGGALAGSAAAAPSGMVTVADSQITQEVPEGESIPVSAADLEGAVLASSGHADSLEVIATTPGHADEVMGTDANVVGSGQMALVFRDSADHESREIAVDAGLLREALGYTPETVRGTHSSGETWRSEATYEDGSLVMTIESFSSNTVTFSGAVDISMTGATTGTSAQWELSDYDSASGVTINTTGVKSTETDSIAVSAATNGQTVSADIAGNIDVEDSAEVVLTGHTISTWQNQSGSGLSPTATESLDPGGNVQPTDGNGNNPQIAVTAHESSTIHSILTDQGDGTIDSSEPYLGDDMSAGYEDPVDGLAQFQPKTDGTVDSITLNISGTAGSDYGVTFDVYIAKKSYSEVTSDAGAFLNGQGTQIKSGWDPEWSTGTQTITTDTQYEVSAGSTYTLQILASGTSGDTAEDYLAIATDDSPSSVKSGAWVDTTDRPFEKRPDIQMNIVNEVNGLSVADGAGASASFGDFTDGETKTARLDLSQSSTALDFSGSGTGTIDYQLTMQSQTLTEDPEIDIDGDGTAEASYTGLLSEGESTTQTVDPSLTDDSWTVSTNGGSQVDVSTEITEGTVLKDPTIELNGNTTTLHSGTLADGETVQTTIPKSQLREGSNQLNVSLADGSLSADAPAMQADIELSHDAADQIGVSYRTTAFEETYNVSHTYADATADAQVTIPFASERIVEVASLEYRIDGGTWQSVSAQNYRLDGTTLDVYLSDAYGGDIPSGSTVDVRATGRRIDVANGAVTVTEATAPGDELDTQLRIDSRSPGFHVNVGPTANGERIHHATSSDYPTTDYAIIEADGDQRLYLPNSKQGDHFRVNYIQTMAMPEKGDVKITVEKAGSDPELDIDPGPMGAGDPVTYKYYRTTSGVEYILNSITQGVVRDSDVANSPAIFEDDDSDELLSIFAETSSSTDDGGGAGVWDQASSAVGSVQTPSMSVPSWLPIAGVLLLGGGAVVVVSRRVFGSSEPPTAPAEDPRSRPTGSSSSSSSGGLVSRLLRGSGGLLVSVLTGSGRLLAWLTRRGGRLGLGLLKLLNKALMRVLANTYAAVLLAVGGFLFAGQLGLVPGRAITLGSVIGLLVATLWGLQKLGIYSNRLFLLIGGLVSIGAVELLSPGLLQQFVGQLPIALLAILGTSILAIWFIFVRRTEASTPETVNTFSFRSGGGGSSDDDDNGGEQ